MKPIGVYEAVQDLFSQTARQFSSSVAIDNGRRRVTYGELEASVERLRATLIDSGVTRGSIVGIFVTDPIDIITSILAILKAGGVFCPLDPTFPEQRLRVMFESVSPSWCVTQSQFQEKLQRISEAPAAILIDAISSDKPTLTTDFHSDPEAPCSIYFTS